MIVSFTAIGMAAQTPVDTTQILRIGGIKQLISLKGKDKSKPLLLFLHGGPGGSAMSYAHTFTDKLREYFIVVQWDQRETGKTLSLNPSSSPLTGENFQNDTHELIKVLLRQFNRNKLYLVGHSWGTYLGFYIARNFPDLLYAYIPVCPMINQLESERLILSTMKDKATKSNNKKAMEELATVKIPFENGEQLYYHRKWLLAYNGSKRKLSKDYVIGWSSRWLSVFNEASRKNLILDLPSLRCPIYFFLGRKDNQTNSGIAENYFKKLNALKKGLFWFENSGHNIPTTEPQLMQDIIISKILPETFH